VHVPVHGGRDVRATLSDPADPGSPDDAGESTPAAVVACPPHPQFGGNRDDGRLTAVSDLLVEEGVACLRFDYGEWDGGPGEREDARNAVRWVRDRYDRAGIFGYSFGGAIAVLAAAEGPPVGACASLAPASQVGGLDAVAALERLDCPYRVVYGARDTTADWEPLVERARELGHRVEEFSADHHFVGQHRKVARPIAEFLVAALG